MDDVYVSVVVLACDQKEWVFIVDDGSNKLVLDPLDAFLSAVLRQVVLKSIAEEDLLAVLWNAELDVFALSEVEQVADYLLSHHINNVNVGETRELKGQEAGQLVIIRDNLDVVDGFVLRQVNLIDQRWLCFLKNLALLNVK